MSNRGLACNWCGKADFKSREGLVQHLNQKEDCRAKEYGVKLKKPSINTVYGSSFMAFTEIAHQKSWQEMLADAGLTKPYGLPYQQYDQADTDFDCVGEGTDSD